MKSLKTTVFWILAAAFISTSSLQAGLEATTYRCQKVLEWIALVNGGHPIYEINVHHKGFRELLPETLKEFAKNKPTLKNILKQYVLFNPLLVSGTHWALTGRKSKAVVTDLYQAIAPGVKFNYVIHGNADDPDQATILIGQVEVKIKRLDDLLSKHLLLANFHPDIRYAGEFWKDEAGVIHFSNNSGTYKPDPAFIGAVEQLLREAFQDDSIQFHAEIRDPDEEKAKRAAEAKKTSLFQRIREAARGLDAVYPLQMALKQAIFRTTSERRIVRVPLSMLDSIHPMVGVNDSKVEARAQALRVQAGLIRSQGVLSLELQDSLIPSKTPMSVILTEMGGYVLFDGNGRLKAAKRAFEDDPNLPVEVVLYETKSPLVQRWLRTIRNYRGI